MDKRIGFLDGQLTFGGDFDTLSQPEIEAAFHGEPDSDPAASGDHLATNDAEEGKQLCQVCEFPAIAGHVQGELRSERYSLHVCPSCFEYAILCLRDSYRQNRLFDDDFEIEELCRFGKASPPLGGEEKDWEQMRPVGREFGADHDD